MNKLFTYAVITFLVTITHSELLPNIESNAEAYHNFNPFLTPSNDETSSSSNMNSPSILVNPLELRYFKTGQLLSDNNNDNKNMNLKNHYGYLRRNQLKEMNQPSILTNDYNNMNSLQLVKRVLADYKRRAILADYKRSTYMNK
ncbi:unnamed protein product [Trichobilharzia szidati]|nr:unnamed protein product [Trichobilharzia szidati]